MNPSIGNNLVGRRRQIFASSTMPIFGSPNMPSTPTERLSDHSASSRLSGVPRNQSRSTPNRIRSAVLPEPHNAPQTLPSSIKQPARITDDDAEYASPYEYESPDEDDLDAAKPRRNSRVIGVELENRRRQAEARIRQGGWKPDIAEMAIEWTEAKSWNDDDAQNFSLRAFARDVEGLGELCSDMKAIRAFLDDNIHKFIAFHAMRKDFKVPPYLVHKADQRRRDKRLKYPWLWSFIREYQYQGAPSGTNESLVQVYKDHVDEHDDSDRTAQPPSPEFGGSIHVAVPTPTTTDALDTAFAHEIRDQHPDRRHTTMENNARRRKRHHRTFEDDLVLRDNNTIKRARTFATQDDSIGFQDIDYEADVGDAGVEGFGGTGGMGGANDGEEVIHINRRTLKVVFHGTEDGDAEESGPVQLYLPRTSKGFTIHFYD